MPISKVALHRLKSIANLTLVTGAPLAAYTRFQIGGPAAVLCDTSDVHAFVEALAAVESLAIRSVVIGGGTNLVVSDAGFEGVVLRYKGSSITQEDAVLRIESGATLQKAVDYSIAHGLKGLETLTGIPGYVGGAIYGNAGAYGHSIEELVVEVGIANEETVSTVCKEQCKFRYRDSIFKDRKGWIILSTDLEFAEGDPEVLSKIASDIRTIRDAKYPPTMRCAGSIFKNLFFASLPAHVQQQIPPNVVREGKVPSAWFLEQTAAKGMRRGDIQVASYHANLVYNDGAGTAVDLVAVIEELKQRVRDRFGFDLEEEVQYVGFENPADPL